MSNAESPEFDPTTWAEKLVEEMEARAKVYEAEPDWLLKRNKAANIIGAIAGHLQIHPALSQSDCLQPVKDALIFFDALENGSGHPWAKPSATGGTNRETAAESEVRIWALMGVWVLIEGGYTNTAAYRFMANALTASGRQSQGRDQNQLRIRRPFSLS